MAAVLARIVLNAVGLLLTASVVPGVHYEGGLFRLLLAGVLLGAVNLFVRPVVTLLALPLLVLTLGLAYFAINGAMLWLVAAVVPGLSIDGCLGALLGGLVMALFNAVTTWLAVKMEGGPA